MKHYNIQDRDHISLLNKKSGIPNPTGDQESQKPLPQQSVKPDKVIVIEDDNDKNSADEGLIKKFVQMGFQEGQVRLAIKSSQGNPDLILDYLVHGIPKKVDVTYQRREGFQEKAPDKLPFLLTNHPAFPQLAESLRSDPSQIEPLIIKIVNSHPHLLTQISQNPHEILTPLLKSKPPTGQPIDCDMKKEEKEDIEKLVSLNIPRNQALDIYVSFDKNVDLAHNFLLSTDKYL
uniref:UV excision repair protein RAD23 n=1 Tax=Arcella intermedia TaxID=1963864 RepID=A0A6B2LES9_9EUKA